MSGRRTVPGERSVGGIVDPDALHDRTIRAQISDVNQENGLVTVDYDALPSGGKIVTAPVLWMSFPPEGGGPAWGRFMPQKSDVVKLSFNNLDAPTIVGYDVIAHKPGVANGKVGWPLIADHHRSYKAGTNSKMPQFAQFTVLEPGEYDFMSSGGAYIHGNKSGRLYMMGGAVSIALTKNENSATIIADLATNKSGDSELRFGQVRRPVAGLEQKLTQDANGSYKEFNVLVNGPTKVPLAALKLGNVAGPTAVDMSSKGQPLRYSLETNADATPLANFSMKVDSAGNTEIAGKTASLNTEYVDATMKATASHTVESPNIKLGGSSSNNALILTTVYGPAEQQVITQLAAQISALQVQVSAITVAITAYTAAVAAAYPPAAGGATAWTAAMVPINAGLAAVSANVQAAATTFTSNYPTYESKNTFTS